MNPLERNAAWWPVAVLLLVNLALKLAWAGVNELAGDEPFTVYWSMRP